MRSNESIIHRPLCSLPHGAMAGIATTFRGVINTVLKQRDAVVSRGDF